MTRRASEGNNVNWGVGGGQGEEEEELNIDMEISKEQLPPFPQEIH